MSELDIERRKIGVLRRATAELWQGLVVAACAGLCRWSRPIPCRRARSTERRGYHVPMR
jgi:hypothetical protein